VELLDGWHQPEESGWRWTGREFAARFHWEGKYPPRELIIETFVSEQLIDRHKTLSLSFELDGQQLAPEVYRACGPKKVMRKLRAPATPDLVLRCSLSGALSPDDLDPRERGIIVTALRVE
jgi:hypothetical protein